MGKALQTDHLEKYTSALMKVAHKIFVKELESGECLSKKVPLIKWSVCQRSPGALYLYLLCFSGKNRKMILFFEELVSNWLASGEQLKILSSRNLTFRLPDGKRPFFFAELLIHIPDEKTLQAAKKGLPGIADEIKLGVHSSGQARHILEMKRLSLAGKTSFIYETMVSLLRRYPKRFAHDIFRQIQHFLVHCREEFRQLRHVRHLCRIICAHYLFQKALEHEIKAFPHRRHLYLKLMKTHLFYPFGLKKVLGIALALNSLRDYECFELRHILSAVQRVIPSVRAHKESFYSHRSEENNLLTVYLEIEKTKGGDFTLSEIKRLKQVLPNELKNSIEYLSPSLFIPRNEEELIRNIIQLSQELHYLKDLPQAIISFQEQRNDVLKFNIILLRFLNSESSSLADLSKRLPQKVHFMPERVANVGLLRKKYVKEANVFSLEIENQLFLRKNHSVDLVKARQYVVKSLEKMIGNFRDFNGGFLLKQNERLEAIKKELGSKGNQNEFLLENLFYSLSPSIMQTYIPPEEGKELSFLFLKSLEMDLPSNDDCLLQIKRTDNSLVVVVKSNTGEIKEKLSESLKSLILDPLKLASGTVEVERHFYVCYLFLSPSKEVENAFIKTIKDTIETWKEKRQNVQILRLHLPRATQSLDPRIACDRTSGIVIKMLYEGLMRTTTSGEIENGIAQEVTISENWKKYVFKLKKTFWSNGSPLTAYDFEYAWKKILEPDFCSAYSFLFFPIKNAEAAKKGEMSLSQIGVRALDENTLFVELEHPAKYFLGLTASWVYSPLCREIDQKHPGWAYHSGETYVCNGPFKLDMWKLNDDLQVIKNSLYWDVENVKLDRIQVTIIEDEKAGLRMFQRGELDWIGDPLTKIPPSEIVKLNKKNLIHTDEKYYGIFWLQLNIQRLPFQNLKIRKALAYGINRKELIRKALNSEDQEAFCFSHPPKLVDPLWNLDNKFEEAKKLFAEGLSEIKMQLSAIPPIVISHSEIEEQEHIAKYIGEQWKELFGIEVKYERLLWNAYFETLNRGDFMVGGIAWYPRFDDAIYFLNLFIFREHSVHVTHWRNHRFNKLIEKAKVCTDEKKRLSYLAESEKILLEEMPVIPLFYQKFRYIKNPRLKDFILSNYNQIDFRKAYLEKQMR